MTCLSASVSRFWRMFSDSFLFVFCQLSDYGLKHWNAGEGPCLTVNFNKQTKSTTFLLHLKICFHHHVLLWPNYNMLSSFCQRLCKSTWGGVLILIPQGFIKYTFLSNYLLQQNMLLPRSIFKWDLKQYQCDSNTFHNYSAESYVFTCQALSHFTVIFQCTALSDSVKLSFWPPYNVFPC